MATNTLRAHRATKSLEDALDYLRDAGYDGRIWVKENGDAVATVKISANGVLMARLYLTYEGDDVGYVQLTGVCSLDCSNVHDEHRDAVEESLR